MLFYTPATRGFTLYPFIFIPKRIKGTDYELPYIEHEKVHYYQQQNSNIFWIIKYLTNKRFRWQQEQEAFLAEIKQLKRQNLKVNYEKYKTILLTEYFSMATENEITSWLAKIQAEEIQDAASSIA